MHSIIKEMREETMRTSGTKAILAGLTLAFALAGCAGTAEPAATVAEMAEETIAEPAAQQVEETTTEAPAQETAAQEAPTTTTAEPTQSYTAQVSELTGATGGALAASDIFTERDLTQNADLNGATTIALTSGQDVVISAEGVYVLQGSAENVTVHVEAADTDKVQLVLDGVSITNESAPAIYVKSADKVFVTTTESANVLAVTGAFVADGETNLDAVIFSRSDIVLNGLGSLTISSTENGISSKDDLKITGGTLIVEATADALEANDSVAISGGDISVVAGKDGIHAEYDDGTGYVYVCGGTISVQAASDAIQGTELVQVDGGAIAVTAGEGIEATKVQINGGSIDASCSDDGINASYKSGDTVPVLEINGGELRVTMAQGDTDALDSNGYFIINGGTIDISAQFPFDSDYGVEYNGGTIYVNGQQVTDINSYLMMSPGGMGGMGGPGMMGAPGGPGF